jgi:two-component system NtrC family sensor kinase
MAANVQKSSAEGCRSNLAARSVKSDFQIRFTAGALFLFTVAAIILSWINFQKSREFQVPYDGARWIERNGGLFADRVEPDGPAAKQGITRGDQLVAVNGHEVKNTAGLMRQLYSAGAWTKATYSLVRGSVQLDSSVILAPADKSLDSWLRFIALIYLGIGLYVLLRRWTAPGSTHFYIFCLVSFIAYSFKYTGIL